MEHHETESPQDRARRHRRQAKAREQELATQTEELQQEGRSRFRDQKAREAADAFDGLEVDDPRAQHRCGRRPPVGETGKMDTTSADTAAAARKTPDATGAGALAGQLGELARTLQNKNDFETILVTMVHAALQLIPGAVDASISVAEARRTIRCHAPSSDLPSTVDRLQE